MKSIMIFFSLFLFLAIFKIFYSLVDVNEKNTNLSSFSFILIFLIYFTFAIIFKNSKIFKSKSNIKYFFAGFIGGVISFIFYEIAKIDVIQSFFTQWIPFLILTAIFSIVLFVTTQIFVKIEFEEKKLLISQKFLTAHSSLYIVMYLILLLFYFLKIQIEDPMRYGIAGLLAIIGVILSFFIEDKEKTAELNKTEKKEIQESN